MYLCADRGITGCYRECPVSERAMKAKMYLGRCQVRPPVQRTTKQTVNQGLERTRADQHTRNPQGNTDTRAAHSYHRVTQRAFQLWPGGISMLPFCFSRERNENARHTVIAICSDILVALQHGGELCNQQIDDGALSDSERHQKSNR